MVIADFLHPRKYFYASFSHVLSDTTHMALIHDHLAFHNCEELEPVQGLAGLRLQRFPAAVRDSLGFKSHSRGRFFSHRASGCEVRFVTDGKFVRLSLSAIERDAEVIV